MPLRKRRDWEISSDDRTRPRARHRHHGTQTRRPTGRCRRLANVVRRVRCVWGEGDADVSEDASVVTDRKSESDGIHADDHGAAMEEHLLGKYACTSMSAKNVCITCYHVCKKGCVADNLCKWAMTPGQSSDGHYKRHLRTVLPRAQGAPEFCLLDVPVFQNNAR